MSPRRQAAIGLTLSTAVIAGWLTFHIYGLFYYPLQGRALALAPLAVAAISWLNVGLFIVAHDAMHGSLAPGRPRLNRAFGQVTLGLYAGFSFAALTPKHHAHHRSPGTSDDPDFCVDHPRHLWRWYGGFMRQYFGWRQAAILSALTGFYILIGVRYPNLLLFWALPALLSSLQLFYFGTYLPHRQEDRPFADTHNARSNGLSWLGSLLSCYHFGYHHEHHLAPHIPWWRLPSERRARGPAR